MAWDDLSWALAACTDCVGHIANDECGTCHEPGTFAPGHEHWHGWYSAATCPGCQAYRASAAEACPVGKRIARRWQDATLIVAGDEGTWWGTGDCGVCGDDAHGDRERVYAYAADPRPPVREITYRGLPVRVERCLDAWSLYASVTLPDGTERHVWTSARSGVDRYGELAMSLRRIVDDAAEDALLAYEASLS